MGVQIQHVIYTNVTQVDSRVECSQHIVKTVGHQRTHDLVFNVETLVYLPLVQSHDQFDLGVTSHDLFVTFTVFQNLWRKWTLAQKLLGLEWCNLAKSEPRVFTLGFSISSSA